MAQIGVAPIILKNIVVTLGGNSFEKAVTQCQLTPTAQIQSWKGGTPDAIFTDMGAPTWVCDMTFGQDWSTVGALAQYLLKTYGSVVPFTFKPIGDGVFTAAGQMRLAVPPVGGSIDAWLNATVQHGIVGQPTFTYPTGA